jgi:hypothetical protein
MEYIEDAGIMHLGDNLARHSRIMFELLVGQIQLRQALEVTSKPRRPSWYKATDQDIFTYADLWCNDLHWSDPQHKQDRDNHMLDLLSAIIESSHIAIPLTK